MRHDAQGPPRKVVAVIAIAIVLIVIVLPLATRFVKIVPPGHVAVANLFGDIIELPYEEGLHVVNPFYSWTEYDARQKTHKESAGVPSQDQLTTSVDVSVQWRIDRSMAPAILKDTGTVQNAIDVHLVPRVRSLLREQGKSIVRAEDFFLEETQQRLQGQLTDGLQAFLATKGIQVESVLIREISLPPRLITQIEQKKEAEQQAERQKAELDRFRTEQEQLAVQAQAERAAAEEEAQKRRVLADAQAYEITKINEALANAPGYIQLQAIRALEQISKDPAAKMYFLNGDSPMPLPLMNIGQPLATSSASGR